MAAWRGRFPLGVLGNFKSLEAQFLPGLAEVSGGTKRRRGFELEGSV